MSIPDHDVLLRELRLLERKTSPSGKDHIDHPKVGSDDFANALFGALYLASRSATHQKVPMVAPFVITESGVLSDPSWNVGIADNDPDRESKLKAQRANTRWQTESQQIAAKSTSGRGYSGNINDGISFAAIGGRTKRINWR